MPVGRNSHVPGCPLNGPKHACWPCNRPRPPLPAAPQVKNAVERTAAQYGLDPAPLLRALSDAGHAVVTLQSASEPRAAACCCCLRRTQPLCCAVLCWAPKDRARAAAPSHPPSLRLPPVADLTRIAERQNVLRLYRNAKTYM